MKSMDKEKPWHGWTIHRDNSSFNIHVGKYPNRKKIALYTYRIKDNIVYPLAYFRSEKYAREFMEMMDDLCQIIDPSCGIGGN